MIEHRNVGADGDGGHWVITHICEACGAKISAHDRRLSYHLLADHDPEDFGLSPLGEGSVDAHARRADD